MNGPRDTHAIGGGLALLVGCGTALLPYPFLRLFGVPADQINGATTWGWRMFGIRTALIGGLIVSGNRAATKAMIPVQLADQVTFAIASRDERIPPVTIRLAQAISIALMALSTIGFTKESQQSDA